MMAIDEAKVKAVVQELKGKASLLTKIMLQAQSDDTRQALLEDMIELQKLIVLLDELPTVPDEAWILEVGEE